MLWMSALAPYFASRSCRRSCSIGLLIYSFGSTPSEKYSAISLGHTWTRSYHHRIAAWGPSKISNNSNVSASNWMWSTQTGTRKLLTIVSKKRSDVIHDFLKIQIPCYPVSKNMPCHTLDNSLLVV